MYRFHFAGISDVTDAHLQCSAVQGRSLILGPTNANQRCDREIQVDVQRHALATTTLVQEIMPGINQCVIPRGGCDWRSSIGMEVNDAVRTRR
jgi:hypothetical protein